MARVWERPSGWKEGVTDQRARSREGRKEGVCREGSRVPLKQMVFLFGLLFDPQMREVYCMERLRIFALGVRIYAWSVFVNVTVTAVYYSGHN